MAINYAAKVEKVRLKLAQNGTAATIMKRQLLGGSAYDPIFTAPEPYPVQVLILSINEKSESSSENTKVEAKVMIAVPETITPIDGDQITISAIRAEPFIMQAVQPFAPGGVTVFFNADLIN